MVLEADKVKIKMLKYFSSCRRLSYGLLIAAFSECVHMTGEELYLWFVLLCGCLSLGTLLS